MTYHASPGWLAGTGVAEAVDGRGDKLSFWGHLFFCLPHSSREGRRGLSWTDKKFHGSLGNLRLGFGSLWGLFFFFFFSESAAVSLVKHKHLLVYFYLSAVLQFLWENFFSCQGLGQEREREKEKLLPGMEQCSRRGGLKKRLYGRSQVRRVLLAKINHTCHLAVRLFTIPRRLRWREHISSARTAAAAAREMKCNKNMLTCHFTTAHNYQNKCVHTSFFKKKLELEKEDFFFLLLR